MKKLVALFLVLVLALGATSAALAEEKWVPQKAVTVIVPWAAGGSADIFWRLIAAYIEPYLGTAMVIDNQGGGSTIPGTQAIADAEPDGYTVGMNWNAAFLIRPLVLPEDVTYTIEDFSYIIGTAIQDLVIVVRADSPFQTINELIAYALEHPGELIYTAGQTTGGQYLLGEWLKAETGADIINLPTSGGAEAITFLRGGQSDFAIGQPSESFSAVEAGELRYLCSLGDVRPAQLPDVPCLTESMPELAGKVFVPYTMILMGPAGLEQNVIDTIHDAVKAVLDDPAFQAQAKDMGIVLRYIDGASWLEETMSYMDLFKEIVPKYMLGQ